MSISRVRFLLGSILLVAAALKAESLFLSSATLFTTGLLTAGLVLTELVLAGFLFSGAMPRPTWWAAVLCFGSFAIVASVKIWRGEADCGCFGAVATPPWVALAIDLAALGMLLFNRVARLCASYPRFADWNIECRTRNSEGRSRNETMPSPSSFEIPGSKFCGSLTSYPGSGRRYEDNGWSRLPVAIAFALIALVGIKTVVAVASVQPALAATDPTTWVGGPLPLLADIDVGTQIKTGRWEILFHRSGCGQCEKVLDQLTVADRDPEAPQLAIIQMSPSEATKVSKEFDGLVTGNLHGGNYKTIPAPLLVRLTDGVVEQVVSSKEVNRLTPLAYAGGRTISKSKLSKKSPQNQKNKPQRNYETTGIFRGFRRLVVFQNFCPSDFAIRLDTGGRK